MHINRILRYILSYYQLNDFESSNRIRRFLPFYHKPSTYNRSITNKFVLYANNKRQLFIDACISRVFIRVISTVLSFMKARSENFFRFLNFCIVTENFKFFKARELLFKTRPLTKLSPGQMASLPSLAPSPPMCWRSNSRWVRETTARNGSDGPDLPYRCFLSTIPFYY